MSTSIDKFRIVGLCAAPYTPFCDNVARDVDFESIPAHVEALISQDVLAAFVCGTTGEGVTMSVAERKQVLEAWLKHSAGRLTIIASVGSESIADMLDLSKHAVSAGVAALGVQATCFNKPPSIDSLVDLLAAISAAAPSVPLYYYHIPSKTGVTWRCDELLRALHPVREARVPTFRGIKFSDSDFHILANCVAFAGGFYDVLSGKDEMLLAALAMGCRGAVGSTYNYQGALANKIIAAFKAGDMVEALRLQRILQAGVDLLLEGGKYGPAGVNVGKALLEIRLGGKHVGPPRYPAPAMPEEGKVRLRAAAEAAGFFSELE